MNSLSDNTPHPPSIAIITPTLGRTTLPRTLESCWWQLGPDDEWLVVGDGPQPAARALVERLGDSRARYLEVRQPRSAYGNAQRNLAMHAARAGWFLFLDDDDELLPGALDAVRQRLQQPLPLMFRMDYRPGRRFLWEQPVLREGNVGGGMFVIPNLPGRWAEWPETDRSCVGDFTWIRQTLALWPAEALQWCEDVIYLCHQHGEGQ